MFHCLRPVAAKAVRTTEKFSFLRFLSTPSVRTLSEVITFFVSCNPTAFYLRAREALLRASSSHLIISSTLTSSVNGIRIGWFNEKNHPLEGCLRSEKRKKSWANTRNRARLIKRNARSGTSRRANIYSRITLSRARIPAAENASTLDGLVVAGKHYRLI